MFGAVEAGGTKFVVGVGQGPGALAVVERIPTVDPPATLGAVAAILRSHAVEAVGVACFGPLDGRGIGRTPKPGWSGVPVADWLEDALGVPVALDTDVNGAALGEAAVGCAVGCDPFLYVTVGTGIGGGLLRNGRPVPGLEMGHVRVPHDRGFAGVCPFHGDCVEGLVSGPALEARWGRADLPVDHAAWDEVVAVLAGALASWTVTLAPQRICLGGGVGSRPELLPRLRRALRTRLGGYPRDIDPCTFLVQPALGDESGVRGALVLAGEAKMS